MTGEPAPPSREKIIWAVLVAGLLAVAGAAVVSILHTRRAAELDRLGRVPDFTLVTETGDSLSASELRGTVWAADFIFTRCLGICPRLSTTFNSIQSRLAGTSGWKLVSFSVDPEYDRPPVLAEYAKNYQADPAHWAFLTGDKDKMIRIITQGFFLAVEEDQGTADEPIVHTQRIVLVDAEGEIRGYYDSSDPEAVDRLVADIPRLVRESS